MCAYKIKYLWPFNQIDEEEMLTDGGQYGRKIAPCQFTSQEDTIQGRTHIQQCSLIKRYKIDSELESNRIAISPPVLLQRVDTRCDAIK